MDWSSRPKQRADYRLEALDGELLLYHPAQTKVLYCNETASLIWKLCDGQHTANEIVVLLAEAFPEAMNTIRGDTEAALQRLQEHGAVEFT